ncbi:GNAT family N-acetyltransferase [Photobacterium halotolerans]|uniref:GNAT family N-acetyltransferase n=1 Tax=Photobacterium halotolerans TaxID=265726 RepID=UPI0003FA63AC|nr:GNAT family N-acetyltransferase [Photobacterium halotolerans]
MSRGIKPQPITMKRQRVGAAYLQQLLPADKPDGLSLIAATPRHERFVFELKKAAEREAVTQVFGWDEALQYQLHLAEWLDCKPLLILMDGIPIGSVLLETMEPEFHPTAEQNSAKLPHSYFSRFFLLPQWQGRGIGSAVLRAVIAWSDKAHRSCCLTYLQGNPVSGSYRRFGFETITEDSQFVTMVYHPNTKTIL